ncbi:MAG: GNAT family N-acetyltransferase [bacterium]
MTDGRGRLVGGAPGTAWSADRWRRVHDLFETSFPGLSAGIERAAAVGMHWAEVTTPFVWYEGEDPICHVGVLEHPVLLAGEPTTVAGIHAVCTRPDRRGRGLARRVLGAALEWIDARHALTKLHTDVPAIYARHGFRPQPTFRFRACVAADATVERRLLRPLSNADDLALLTRTLARRAPASEVFATRDPGWLTLIDAALRRELDTTFWHVPAHAAIVAHRTTAQGVHLHDVIAPTLPPASAIVPPGASSAWWTFAPDRFDPAAEPEPCPPVDGVLLVRGDWPETSSPIGISPLWEH